MAIFVIIMFKAELRVCIRITDKAAIVIDFYIKISEHIFFINYINYTEILRACSWNKRNPAQDPASILLSFFRFV